jgi:uroporphyrin-3 C-methyltransferase
VAKTSKPAVSDELPKQTESPQGKKKNAPAKTLGRSMAGFKTLVAVVVVISLVAGAWWLQLYWQADRQAMSEHMAALAAKVDGLELNYKSTDKAIFEQSQRIEEVEKFTTDLGLILSQQNQRLRELNLAASDNRVIAEALHLSQIASWRVQTERSNRIPLALLNNADVVLSRLEGINIATAREVLAADIQALQRVDTVDYEALFLELSLMATNINQLKMVTSAPTLPSVTKPSVTKPSVTKPSTADIEDVSDILEGFIDNLGQLVRIRQHNQPITPLLDAADQKVVRHNLLFQFQYAQTALLRGQQSLYQQSLTAAKAALEQYFQQSTDLQTILQRLDQLVDTRIAEPLPRVDASVQAIQALMQSSQVELLESQEQNQ